MPESDVSFAETRPIGDFEHAKITLLAQIPNFNTHLLIIFQTIYS